MTQPTSRRDFFRTVGVGAVAAAGTAAIVPTASARPAPAPAKSRVIGANDRINVGFVGCGGRMNTHITHIVGRHKGKADVQAIAVNDIWETRKQAAREKTGVDAAAVHHDYRELVTRPDIDAVVIGSPDHWHFAHAMAALEAGKDVYLEKPMTYTADEARRIAEYVKSSGRILQVGSQYTSLDHFHKARKVVEDGLIGQVVWTSGGFGRNSTKRGNEWNYRIDPDANESNLDWKAFIGNAPKRDFDPARYFRWRKYWDYSGGIATDLFYHTVSPLLMTVGPEFPVRVSASGGIYIQKDREVPDTFFMNVDYPSWTMQLACSVTSGKGAPLIIHGSEGTLIVAEDSEAFNNTEMVVVPDRDYKDDFVKKTGKEEMRIAVQPFVRGEHPHMDNFLDSVRSREKPNLDAELGYKAMTAIAGGVTAYRKNKVVVVDPRSQKFT
ncbi:MAG: Gfo/Idh/MocA family oxidoreductase [Acidobacteria bacterium]|nr:Gfo/Idh/MocA family oxidoreductase [Acidobacteriota bacterium]